MDDDIQTWWEIPSIVHFCNTLALVTKDISRININEFENAVEENSYMLTDMAIRFTKICGYFDPNTNKWWNFMKRKFLSKCTIYNFKYSLDSAIYFDDLTRKQKVETLYIYCNFVLDVKYIQNKISINSDIWHMLNIKPLGYDLNKSVYWYFGTNKLYREVFENSFDLSTGLPVDCNLHEVMPYEPYPSGVFGSGKWNTICDNINSWQSLADNFKYRSNVNVKKLHKAISDIIINLPIVKRKKFHYEYIKPKETLRSLYGRTLRSMGVTDAEKKLISNSNVIQQKQYSQNVMENQSKHKYNSTVSQRNETSNLNIQDQNQNISYPSNVFDNDMNNVNANDCDQENNHNLNDLKRRLRSSTNRTLTPPFKNLNYYSSET
ncbi:cat eye syndrome critical region protein 2-like [Myzus persicae]|uniref:cat eye syndrome critical region protein 2-like n=1 Tax=Myzus persicae TaxID=13164 RepID=UPI000B933840|nr:cat eye syndrome critical region protein 2-like [Myzus persicae]